MANKVKLPCGCELEAGENGQVLIPLRVEEVPECQATWDMICEGNTKGVFQLESQLGRSKAKQAKPRTIEELADLISILRPGTGDAIVDGKSLTQHYIDRKIGKDRVIYPHPALENILKDTYGVIVYQEQAMKISELVAGFNLQQADDLRKAIGKKKVELMEKVKNNFISCAKTLNKFTEEEIHNIFALIEKAQRYSFNKSHAVAYATLGYHTVYAKLHAILPFFTSCLRHAHGKPDPMEEKNELINNAKMMDLEIRPPSILYNNKEFKIKDNIITFGLTDIKGIGDSVYNKYRKRLKELKTKNPNFKLEDITWQEFLIKFCPYIKSDALQSMISVGALDCFKVSRNKMLYEYGMYKQLKEEDIFELSSSDHTELIKAIVSIIEKTNKKNQTVHTAKYKDLLDGCIMSIQSPSYSTVDMPSWKAKQEEIKLSTSITSHILDEYDMSNANMTCLEYIKGQQSKAIAIGCEIEYVREYKVKRGENAGKMMAYLKISDHSAILDNVVVFCKELETYKNLLFPSSLVLVRGIKDAKTGDFILKSIQKLEKLKLNHI